PGRTTSRGKRKKPSAAAASKPSAAKPSAAKPSAAKPSAAKPSAAKPTSNLTASSSEDPSWDKTQQVFKTTLSLRIAAKDGTGKEVDKESKAIALFQSPRDPVHSNYTVVYLERAGDLEKLRTHQTIQNLGFTRKKDYSAVEISSREDFEQKSPLHVNYTFGRDGVLTEESTPCLSGKSGTADTLEIAKELSNVDVKPAPVGNKASACSSNSETNVYKELAAIFDKTMSAAMAEAGKARGELEEYVKSKTLKKCHSILEKSLGAYQQEVQSVHDRFVKSVGNDCTTKSCDIVEQFRRGKNEIIRAVDMTLSGIKDEDKYITIFIMKSLSPTPDVRSYASGATQTKNRRCADDRRCRHDGRDEDGDRDDDAYGDDVQLTHVTSMASGGRSRGAAARGAAL
ncbi:hypothetical protein THAOC_08868, partial [Thalassiosira oceanica]